MEVSAGDDKRRTPVCEASSCQRSASRSTLNVDLSAARETVIKVLVTLIKSQYSCFVLFFKFNSHAFHFSPASSMLSGLVKLWFHFSAD